MKFNFRKIASVFASVVMLGSTIGIAAAANYPAPFVQGGAANVAVVYGTGSGVSFTDGLAAGEIQSSLQFELGKQTAQGGTTVTAGSCAGECAPLFTGSSRIYVNDSLNAVKSVVTKTELPVLLKDGSFSGNVDATYTQTISLGSNPYMVYVKQPTSSDNPQLGLALSTTAANYVYNASLTFNKAVNLSSADSKNQELTLFGQKYSIGAATDGTSLVLLKEATKVSLDSSGTTSQEVTIGGKTYTVELTSASEASSATVKVTDAAGTSDTKTINVGATKKVNGLTIAVSTANSNNLKYAASVVAGAEKVTLSSGNAVTFGESDTVIDGTQVTFDSGPAAALTKITVSVYAPNSDKDAILTGQSLVDPVFGTFKLDLSGFNVPENGTAREDIKIKTGGDDKLTLDMTDYGGNAKTGIQYIYNTSVAALQPDTNGHNYIVAERVAANRSDYIMVGNEGEGHLIKVSQIVNQTTAYANDKVIFTDVFTGDSYTATLTADGAGTVTIGGKVYSITYSGANDLTEDARTVRLNHPDSAGNNMLIYPTISTSKGAKVGFYKPLTINLSNWDGSGNIAAGIMLPNGANAYQTLAVAFPAGTTGNFTINGGADVSVAGGSYSTTLTNTGLTFNFTYAAPNQTTVYLVQPGGGNLLTPGLFIYEPKDDNNKYNALVVTGTYGGTSTTGIGVGDVYRTWLTSTSTGSANFRDSTASDSNVVKAMDLWGAVVTKDSTDSKHPFATISFPSEQMYPQLYIAANDATVTPGTSSGGSVADIGTVLVKDNEISSVSAKNLIVVGGSCINSVAAKVLGSATPICGTDFTTATNVGANKALVKVVESPYSTTSVAMLVAGWEASDTTKAVKWVMTEKPLTDKGTVITLETSSTVATKVVAA